MNIPGYTDNIDIIVYRDDIDQDIEMKYISGYRDNIDISILR